MNQIGLGEFDMGYLLIGMGAVILLLIIFLILLIVQIRKTSKLKKRLDKFLSGKAVSYTHLTLPTILLV